MGYSNLKYVFQYYLIISKISLCIQMERERERPSFAFISTFDIMAITRKVVKLTKMTEKGVILKTFQKFFEEL